MHYAEFQKNLMEKFKENFRPDGRMDREKDGWTNGRSKFVGSFQPRLGAQKVMHKKIPPLPSPKLNTVDSFHHQELCASLWQGPAML